VSDFNEILIFSTEFRNIHTYQIWWKFVHFDPSCSMRTDRRTGGRTCMMKLIVIYISSANARPKVIKSAVQQLLSSWKSEEWELNFTYEYIRNYIYAYTEKLKETLVKSMHYFTEYNFCVLRISADFVLPTVESGFSYRDSLVYLVHILVTTQTVSCEGATEQKPPVGFLAFLFNP